MNKREEFMKNVLDLSVNAGKINGNANEILYSEETKAEKRNVIKQTKDDLCKIVENVLKIAESLEIPIEEIINKGNANK